MNSKYDNNFSESEALSSDESIDYCSDGEVVHYEDNNKVKNMINDYFYNAPADKSNTFMDLDQMIPARLIRWSNLKFWYGCIDGVFFKGLRGEQRDDWIKGFEIIIRGVGDSESWKIKIRLD